MSEVSRLFGHDVKDKKAREEIEVLKENQIILEDDDLSGDGIDSLSHSDLETNAKKIVPAINEVNNKVENIANNFTTERSGNNFIIKYKGITIAEIPLITT